MTARNEVENRRSVLENIPRREFTESNLKSTATWIDNIEARIDDFIAQHKSGVENEQNDTTDMSYRELRLALRKHLDEIGKNGVKGYHILIIWIKLIISGLVQKKNRRN